MARLTLAFPDSFPAPVAPDCSLSQEVQAILSLQAHAARSPDLLYCSPVIRHLIEQEIPRLVELTRR